MSKVLISAITYKRSESLKTLLNSLATLNIEDNEVSILVVDNDCTGENQKIVSEVKSPIKIDIVEESEPGIPFARNKSVEEFLKSDNEFLVFIDDDETIDDNWLLELLKAHNETNANIVSGNVITKTENDNTNNHLDFLHSVNKENLAVLDKFYTGSLLIERKVLELVKPAFDGRFRYTGSSDLHFSMKCIKEGYKAVYAKNAISYEWMQASRVNFKWIVKRGFRSGAGYSLSKLYIDNSLKTYIHCLFMGGARFIFGLISMVGNISNNSIFDKSIIGASTVGHRERISKFNKAIMRISSGVGSIAGIFRINYNEYKNTHGQ